MTQLTVLITMWSYYVKSSMIFIRICTLFFTVYIQSTLVISKSKGPSETLRGIRTSTYQIWKIEENTNGITNFYNLTCDLTPLVRDIC